MDLGKSRYRVNSIKMRKNVYRLLGILIMAMFSFAPLYAYELKVRVENESTHEPVIEYEVHAYMNNATHDFVCKAVFSPADSTFMFTDLPENEELTVGGVAEGGLYGDIVNGERPPLVIHRIASPFMSYRIGSGDRAGR